MNDVIFIVTRRSEMVSEEILIGAFRSRPGADKAIIADIEELDTERDDYEIRETPLED